MGTVSGESLTAVAKHLLDVLGREPHVLYSRFYDGKDRTADRLAAQLGVSGGSTPVALLVDLAIFHLENEGLVERADVATRLADGEPDYQIRLTPKGKRFLSRGAPFVCPHTEL